MLQWNNLHKRTKTVSNTFICWRNKIQKGLNVHRVFIGVTCLTTSKESQKSLQGTSGMRREGLSDGFCVSTQTTTYGDIFSKIQKTSICHRKDGRIYNLNHHSPQGHTWSHGHTIAKAPEATKTIAKATIAVAVVAAHCVRDEDWVWCWRWVWEWKSPSALILLNFSKRVWQKCYSLWKSTL